jgi:Fe(3+) dicitrate transport protein
LPRAFAWLQQHGHLQKTMIYGRGSKRSAICAAAIIVGTPGSAAWSQSSSANNSDPAPSQSNAATTPIEVEVIGDKPGALQSIPGSGTVVTTQQIDRAAPLNTGEMLRRVPGLQVREDEGAGLRLDVSVRGLDGTRSRRILVLEDGMPVAINPYGEPDLYYGPPIERMRGIEVVKGSGSILFGPQTIGGVINFQTIAPPVRRELLLDARGGAPNYVRLLGRYGDAIGKTRYVVQVFHKSGDGGRDQPFHSTDMLAKIRFSTSASGRATLKIGIHDEVVSSTDVGLTTSMFEQDPLRPTIAPDDEVRLRHYDVALIHEQTFSKTTRLRTLMYAYTTSRLWRRQDFDRRRASNVQYTRIVGDSNIPMGAIFFRSTNTIRDRNYQVVGLEPRLEKQFSTGTIRHNVDAGARFLAEFGQREQRSGSSTRTFAGVSTHAESHHSFAFAAHVQDRVVFRDNLTVIPGLRLEHVESTRNIERMPIAGISRDVNLGGTNAVTAVIPGVGMVLGKQHWQAFGGLHVGFAPPRITSAVNAEGVAENLAEERSLNYEVGARVFPNDHIHLATTASLSNFENQVVPSNRSDNPTTDLVNGGQTRHWGLENTLTLNLGDLAGLHFPVDFSATYTFLRATFVGGDLDGHGLPYTPKHSMSAIVDVEHPVGIGGQFAWTYVGEQFTDDGGTLDADASGREGLIEGYGTFDAVLHYRHQRSGLSANIALKNILGDVHIASRRPDGIFPTRMRQVLFGARWNYH